jgi:probable HAF family extracellular repeat protein
LVIVLVQGAEGVERDHGETIAPVRACDKIDPFSRTWCSGGTSVYVGLRIRAHSQKARDLTAREGASMNTRTIRSTLIGSLGVALALLSGSALAISFRITDLGTLGGTTSHGDAMNASGQVTGFSTTAGDAVGHAFLWDGTTMVDLGTLGTRSDGVAINASGQVTGFSLTRVGLTRVHHAFLSNGTTMQDLGTIGGLSSFGRAINDAGQVTGEAQAASGHTHAFLWDGTAMRDLGTLRGEFSFGVAINASGQVTGSASVTPGTFAPDLHAFLWNGTAMHDLGTLGGTNSAGVAINDSGQVTGASVTDDPDFQIHAFLWDGTTMVDLGTLGSWFSEGVAINASGQVTGRALTIDGEEHAFLWDGTTMLDLGTVEGGSRSIGAAINASGQVTGVAETAAGAEHAFFWDATSMHDLNALIDLADPLEPFVTLMGGVDINDLGQILANGFDSRTGEEHAYLVFPVGVPEPGTLALLGLGLLGLAVAQRRAVGTTVRRRRRGFAQQGLR